MEALQLSEYRNLQLVDLPIPEPAADEVLIRVAACGICGSDVHGFDGSTGRRIPPLVMGHEAAGVIASVGPQSSNRSQAVNWKPGDRVTFDSTISCGTCRFCQAGAINLCDRREVLGVSCGDYRRNGAFAEYVAVPGRILYALPDSLGFAEAAMIEAVSVALHAVHLTQPEPGSSVLVVGAGMIGLLIVQSLRVAGCGRIIVTDLDPSRLKLAEKLGADQVIQAGKGNVVEQVRQATGGYGADAVLEAVGSATTVRTAIECARKGATVTLVGNFAPEVPIPLQVVVSRQIRLQGSCASSGEYPEAIDLMARKAIDVAPLLTAIVPLAEGPAWFARLYAGEPNLMKVVLTPEQTHSPEQTQSSEQRQ